MAVAYPNPLNQTYLQGVLEARPLKSAIRRNYKGLSLLPQKNVFGHELTWDVLRAENGLAGIYARSGRPTPGSDVLFSSMFATVQSIMASRTLDPDSVFSMRDAGEVSVKSRPEEIAYVEAVRSIRRKLMQCDDEVDSTIEYLIMNALQGSISWPPKDADGNAITTLAPEWGEASFTITFPLRSGFHQQASTLAGVNNRPGGSKTWDQPDADPILDLEVISQLITNRTGLSARGSKIICSSDILSYLAFNSNFETRIAGTETGIRFLNIEDLKNFISNRLGYIFETYDAQWTYRTELGSDDGPTINQVPFLAPGRLIILPPGEDYGNFSVAPCAGPNNTYKNGKMVWMHTDDEPNFETRLGVHIVGFPTPTAIDSVFIFDVYN